jgi:para-nitrobenzyl esterase
MSTVVATLKGKVRGTEERGVYVFRGIPFARPPVGDLRFQPPQPAEPWSGIRDASRFGPAAPQPERPAGVPGGGGSYPNQSEDCLYLNVWTPAADGARRPVLVWIHGGGFTIGTGGDPRYEGAALAARGNVVVVTLNYRLGALGFLHTPDFPADAGITANCGILDQIRALEWVRDEIAAFGGDPGHVTVFGESAGGMSVGTLLGTPRARGLFHRAILQSGAAHHAAAPDAAAVTAHAVLQDVGLSAEEAANLRSLPAERILEAQLRVAALNPGSGMGFTPVVDGDLLPRPPLQAIADGLSGDIPVLIGSNLDEWKLMVASDPRVAGLTPEELAARLTAVLPEDAATPESVARAIEIYRDALTARGTPVDPYEILCAFESDRWFAMPATRLAEQQSRHQSNTYAYLFTWRSPALEGRLGACHALDVPFVFGTINHPVLRPFAGEGPAAESLSKTMQDAWLAFARTGNPSTAALGEWPRYRPDQRATMVLGERCHVENAPLAAQQVFWDGVI